MSKSWKKRKKYRAVVVNLVGAEVIIEVVGGGEVACLERRGKGEITKEEESKGSWFCNYEGKACYHWMLKQKCRISLALDESWGRNPERMIVRLGRERERER